MVGRNEAGRTERSELRLWVAGEQPSRGVWEMTQPVSGDRLCTNLISIGIDIRWGRPRIVAAGRVAAGSISICVGTGLVWRAEGGWIKKKNIVFQGNGIGIGIDFVSLFGECWEPRTVAAAGVTAGESSVSTYTAFERFSSLTTESSPSQET